MSVLRIAVATALVAGAGVTGIAGAHEAPTGMVDAHGSARQVYVTDLPRGAKAELLDRAGTAVATGTADAQGGLLFREVEPGTGYRVRLSSTGAMSTPVVVRSED